MAQQVTQDHRVLKAIVIGLGGLLVLGFAVLVIGLIVKSKPPRPAQTSAPEPLRLPADASIVDMALADRTLVLRVKQPSGEQLVVVDLVSGAVVKRIPVIRPDESAPAAPQ